MTAKQMAKIIGVPENTFSRWKKNRPALYERIIKSFECEATLLRLKAALGEAMEEIEAYGSSGKSTADALPNEDV